MVPNNRHKVVTIYVRQKASDCTSSTSHEVLITKPYLCECALETLPWPFLDAEYGHIRVKNASWS